MAKVEGLVRENHGAESLLPGRNLRTTHPQCTRAHDGPEHGVVVADVRVRPAERRGPILVPLPRDGQRISPARVSKRARPRSARSEPRMPLRSVRARVRPRVRAESGRLTNRASGGCARNDDEASNQTAVKRGKYIGQTGRETAPIRRTKAYHCPTKGQSHLEFRILGPLEVLRGQQALLLGGPKQRALLGLLLVHANEPIARERLIEELWGDAAQRRSTRS